MSEIEHASSQALAGNLEAEGYFPVLLSGNSPQALKAKAADTKSTIRSESMGKKSVLCERQLSHLGSAAGGKGWLIPYALLV